MNHLRYHESKQRGSPDFPLDYHYVNEGHNRYEMPYHWHEEVEILHVLQGFFRLSVGEETYLLAAGDVAFIASGLLHGGTPDDCVYECVVFDMCLLYMSNDHCKQYIGEVLSGRVEITPRFEPGSLVTKHTILPMFDALREQSNGYTLITLGCLFQFIGEVYKFGAYQRKDQLRGEENRKMLKLKTVFERIESRYADPPTLTELSACVGMTPKYFCRFFKEATHRTPSDYIAYYRMEMACYAFTATDDNVTEIALDMGFPDLNYFIRCFKKYKGVTPGRYRQALASAKLPCDNRVAAQKHARP